MDATERGIDWPANKLATQSNWLCASSNVSSCNRGKGETSPTTVEAFPEIGFLAWIVNCTISFSVLFADVVTSLAKGYVTFVQTSLSS
mmetsp:Transcript_10997/g.22919  ORF Transcript_10997/g.22919 Transcript_10997/m.22919 type:complete len:88 (-) Transcript_10997:2128-2391(-)